MSVYRLRPAWRPRFSPDVLVLADLASLNGPTTGRFDPPVELHWQPGTLDFADAADLRRFYSSALTKASRETAFTEWINADTLVEQWLRIPLPHRVRTAWETIHPHLRQETIVNPRRRVQDTVLDAISGLGFALSGGSALIDYDIVTQVPEAIDAVNNRLDAAAFTAATTAVITGCHENGWSTELVHDQDLDKQIKVTVDGDSVVVHLVDHQQPTEPVGQSGSGLRLIFDDVVAGKAVALADSARGRDFHDIAVIVQTPGWDLERIETVMAALHYREAIEPFRLQLQRFRRGEFDDDIRAAGFDPDDCHRLLNCVSRPGRG